MTAREPIVLRGPSLALRAMGSFHVGGRVAEISGKPSETAVLSPGGVPATFDPNGAYQVEAMYVQYFLPEKRRGKVPLLLWHGGGLTGVTYETTPDGRDGWLNMFIRAGFDVYISDAVERGRSGFAPPEVWSGRPHFVTKANPFWRHRIGEEWSADPAKTKRLSGNQFPVEAYDNFARQMVPRWTGTDDAIIAAYTALVDRIGPCIVLCHSQGCGFGFRVAQARPHLFKALIAVEPAVGGDAEQAARLKDVPVLVLYGDFIDQHARWAKMKEAGLAYVAALRAAGRSVDVVDLPGVGIKGNSHMLMMDKNNAEIAALIENWLRDKDLAG